MSVLDPIFKLKVLSDKAISYFIVYATTCHLERILIYGDYHNMK